MRWLGVDEGPPRAVARAGHATRRSQEKLTKINKWYCEQLAYLAKRLAETPEPGGEGSLLDNTLIVWTNELGKGNSHTLDNIPFVLVGNGLDFQMGRSLKFTQGAAQPAAAVAGPRLRPPHRDVRQPRLLRRRPADRADLVRNKHSTVPKVCRAPLALRLHYAALPCDSTRGSRPMAKRKRKAKRKNKSKSVSQATANINDSKTQPTATTNGVVPEPATPTLVIDVGGTKFKMLATGQTEPRQAPSGIALTPAHLVEVVHELASDWEYECISIGLPGQVGDHGPRSEPGNLGPGWVGFDYAAAFGRPVRIMNDAAMQALGSYEGGRMLFLGLGTGLGSTFIAENVIVSLELGQLVSPARRSARGWGVKA